MKYLTETQPITYPLYLLHKLDDGARALGQRETEHDGRQYHAQHFYGKNLDFVLK